MHKILARSFWIVIFTLLAACGTVATPATPTRLAEETITPASPTATLAPSATPAPTASPTPAPLPLFPLDGYVMTFIKDGDLYFQDGENASVKLTHLGEKTNTYYYYELSDDNRKVIFSRGDDVIYSINTDGTQEQVIATKVTGSVPPDSKSGTFTDILGFVPGTHQLLFETAVCESQKHGSPCSLSLFLANADTRVRKKLGDFDLFFANDIRNKNVKASPNGKMIAVGTASGVNILTIDGKIIRRNLLPYKPNRYDTLSSALFWLPDSSGLIVALPNSPYNPNIGIYPASTLWQYTLESNTAIEIPLEPPAPSRSLHVSPDGNWIVYGGLGDGETGVYLGNLADGHTQRLGDAIQVNFSWGPDSKHFIATNAGSVLGVMDASILVPICHLEKWVDASHFICWNAEGEEARVRLAEIEAGVVRIYDLGLGKKVEFSVLIKPK